MIAIYLIMCGIVLIAYYLSCHMFFYGKDSKKSVRQFKRLKGGVYIILAAMTGLFTFFLREDKYNIVICTTITISLIEAIHNIVETRAEEYKEKGIEQERESREKRGELKDIENLQVYGQEILESLKNNRSEENIVLVYEQLNDYFKYYLVHAKVLNTLLEYRNKPMRDKDYEMLEKMWEEACDELKWTAIKVVKCVD